MVRPYFGPELRKSVGQLLTSAVPFLLLWYATYRSLEVSYWLTLALAVPTAAFLMRLFMIQHDCGHGSFFRSKRAADFVGFWIGVLTLTPYQYWRRTHAYHHAHSGDLDFRTFGEIATLTVDEYRNLDWLGKLHYRVYRHPLVLFGPGAAFHFLIKHRYPWDIPKNWKQAWSSVWKTNLALVAVAAVLMALIGWKAFLLVQLPITLFACALGVWLFYVQHQFEDTYWHDHENWDFFDAGLQGSSYLVLPKPLQWLTASIGIHHIHHIAAKIPNYKLQQCLDENPAFQKVTRITLKETFGCIRLTLWDSENNKLIRFKDLRRLQPAS
jgi:omega-6 fatty acid desaturase (delta-12 desaturase)